MRSGCRDSSNRTNHCGRASRWCWAVDWAHSPRISTSGSRFPTPKFPAGRVRLRSATPGKLVIGRLGGLEVVVMAGRAHLYEGYTRAAGRFSASACSARWACVAMVFTNAAGGINLNSERGGLVLISDHINLQGCNPLVGPERRFAGPAFSRYVGSLFARLSRNRAARSRRKWASSCSEGVYAALAGPELRDARRRSAICAPSARIWSACPPCRKSSWPITWG